MSISLFRLLPPLMIAEILLQRRIYHSQKKLNLAIRYRMGFIMKNDSFTCENCKREVSKHPSWSARNHCPVCLYSKHLDKEFPGDRLSKCFWIMKPIWKDFKKNKWWMLVHECIKCLKKIPNKLAEDDSIDVFGKL
jgi:DNA-directed RNA polymerase subunit RPC12/RpoP